MMPTQAIMTKADRFLISPPPKLGVLVRSATKMSPSRDSETTNSEHLFVWRRARGRITPGRPTSVGLPGRRRAVVCLRLQSRRKKGGVERHLHLVLRSDASLEIGRAHV